MVMHPSAGQVHRTDIDGLRGIAVAAVVLFHAAVPGFSGGYVGVDIFFVISGFLITGLIQPRIVAGNFSLLEFYRRRVRRLFPALFLVLTATLVAGSLILLPTPFAALGESTLAATLFASNFYFHGQGGYFSPAAETLPLLHTWSLSVEEQFYIVFPFLLILLQRYQARRITLLVGLLAALSFLAAVVLRDSDARAAFFMPHTRAWELLLGALIALRAVPPWRHRWIREAAAALGLLMILSAVLIITPKSSVPGLAALWPGLGAALLLHAGQADGSVTGRWLSFPPLVGLGLISYSLYLWHWPALTLLRESQLTAPTATQTASVLLLALVLSVLSWRFVEQPCRRAAVSARRTLWLGALGATVVALLSASVVLRDGWPERLDAAARRYAAMLEKESHYALYDRGGCFLDYDQHAADFDRRKCLPAADTPRAQRLLIWGDSFAAHLYPGLREVLEPQGWSIAQYTATSCRPLRSDSNRRCDGFYDAAPDLLAWQGGFGTIVVAAHYPPYLEQLGRTRLLERLKESLALARESGASVILVGQTPIFPYAVPHLLIREPALARLAVLYRPAEDFRALNQDLAQLAAEAGALFFDPGQQGCDGGQCLAALAGEPLHWDYGHLTGAGSRFYAQSLLEALGGTAPMTAR